MVCGSGGVAAGNGAACNTACCAQAQQAQAEQREAGRFRHVGSGVDGDDVVDGELGLVGGAVACGAADGAGEGRQAHVGEHGAVAEAAQVIGGEIEGAAGRAGQVDEDVVDDGAIGIEGGDFQQRGNRRVAWLAVTDEAGLEAAQAECRTIPHAEEQVAVVHCAVIIGGIVGRALQAEAGIAAADGTDEAVRPRTLDVVITHLDDVAGKDERHVDRGFEIEHAGLRQRRRTQGGGNSHGVEQSTEAASWGGEVPKHGKGLSYVGLGRGAQPAKLEIASSCKEI